MAKHFETIIPDAEPSSEKMRVYAPFDNKEIGSVALSDAEHVQLAIKNARKLFTEREAWLSASHRIKILKTLAKNMQAKAEELAVLAASEGGKPLIDSRIEVARAIEGIELCIESMRSEGGTEIPMGLNKASENKLAFTHLEPIGVVVAVSAFNHPLNLIVHQVAPAVATGCPVIVKPAETTPMSCFNFVTMLIEAGLPAGWCQCLMTKDIPTAEKLVTDPHVDFFTFIGSAKVGWMLRSKLSAGTRCALEHGGAAPVIVDKDVDLPSILLKLAKGGFYHAGQVCVSVQRVFAHTSKSTDLANLLAEQAETLVVGDPLSDKTEVGPLITGKELERVDAWVKQAVDEGAKLICGGKKLSESLYAPTVLLDPPYHCEVSQKEIFGPVVCIYSCTDINASIKLANAVPFSFQASVFTNDLNVAMKSYSKLNASAVMVNEHTAFRVDWMPFAGLKVSGFGVGGIPHTMRDMQVEKMMVINSSEL